MDSLPVSKRIYSARFHKVTCCHCNADNWVSDNSRDYDVEIIFCWNCNKESLMEGAEEWIEHMEQAGYCEEGYKTLRDVILKWPGKESLGE